MLAAVQPAVKPVAAPAPFYRLAARSRAIRRVRLLLVERRKCHGEDHALKSCAILLPARRRCLPMSARERVARRGFWKGLAIILRRGEPSWSSTRWGAYADSKSDSSLKFDPNIQWQLFLSSETATGQLVAALYYLEDQP